MNVSMIGLVCVIWWQMWPERVEYVALDRQPSSSSSSANARALCLARSNHDVVMVSDILHIIRGLMHQISSHIITPDHFIISENDC